MPPISQPTGSYGCETAYQMSEVDAHAANDGDSAESHAMTWTSQEDELVSALEDCVSVFRSGLQQLRDISIEGLVFCEPLKDANPLIPPPLQILATANLPFLQYHDWVMTLYLETQKLDCGRFERCRHIKHSLLEDLRNEWTKLEELKRRAWQMASLRSPEPGSAQIINTCEYIV